MTAYRAGKTLYENPLARQADVAGFRLRNVALAIRQLAFLPFYLCGGGGKHKGGRKGDNPRWGRW